MHDTKSNLEKLPLCHAISSTWHFAPMTFCQHDILSLWHLFPTSYPYDILSLHLIPMTSCPYDILSLWHLVPLTSCPYDILSLWHLVPMTSCLFDILSLWHLVPMAISYMVFRQRDIFPRGILSTYRSCQPKGLLIEAKVIKKMIGCCLANVSQWIGAH